METCENCGRTIGKLETPYIHDDHIVCRECKDRLAGPGQQAPMEQGVPQLAAAPLHSAPTSDVHVWRNLKWLGLGMFAVGAVMELSGAPACGYFGLIGLVLWLVAGVVSLSKK